MPQLLYRHRLSAYLATSLSLALTLQYAIKGGF